MHVRLCGRFITINRFNSWLATRSGRRDGYAPSRPDRSTAPDRPSVRIHVVARPLRMGRDAYASPSYGIEGADPDLAVRDIK